MTLNILNSLNESGDYINGTLTQAIFNGSVNFTDNYVLSSGIFQLHFSSDCDLILSNYTTDNFSVSNGVIKVNLTLLDEQIDVFTDFKVFVEVFGDDENYYLGECISSITDQDNNEIESFTTSVGYLNVTLFLNSTDSYTLKTSCGGIESNEIIVKPDPLQFDFVIIDDAGVETNETDSWRNFTAVISILNSFGGVEDKNFEGDGGYPLALRLVSVDDGNSGLTVVYEGEERVDEDFEFYANKGEVNVTFWILSSGTFEMRLVSQLKDVIVNASLEVNSTNHLMHFTIEDESLTVYDVKNFSLLLHGDDMNPLLVPYEVEVINHNDSDSSYTCLNEEGTCVLQNFSLIELGNNTLDFISEDLNETIFITGLTVKIVPESFILPNTSRDLFNLAFQLMNHESEYEITHSYFDSCDVFLSIIPDTDFIFSGRVINVTSESSSIADGFYSYDLVSILSMGHFNLFLNTTCSEIDNWTSEYFLNITNYPKLLELNSSSNNLTAFEYLDITFEITGDDDYMFLGDCLITDDQSIEANDLDDSYDGETMTREYYYASNGSFVTEFNCTTSDGVYVNSSVDSLVDSQNLILTLEPKPYDSELFDLIVELADKDLNTIGSSEYKAYWSYIEITLVDYGSLIDTSGFELTGTTFGVTDGFSIKFADLSILSSGTFKIKAESNSSVTNLGYTEQFTIYNNLVNFTCETSRSLETYFNFDLKVRAIGEDNNTFLLNTTYELILDDSSLEGNLSLEDSTGSPNFTDLHFTSSGSKTIKIIATSSDNSTIGFCTVNVAKSKVALNISSSAAFNFPETSDDFFSFEASVVDENNDNEENNGPYSFKVKLVPNTSEPYSGAVLDGTLIENGTIVNFTLLNVLSYGTFRLEVSTEEDVEAALTDEFLVLNKIKTINFTEVYSSIAFKNITVNYGIYGTDDLPFIRETIYTYEFNSSDVNIFENQNSNDTGELTYVFYTTQAETLSLIVHANTSNDLVDSDPFVVLVEPAELLLLNHYSEVAVDVPFNFSLVIVEDASDSSSILRNADNVIVELTTLCIENSTESNCTVFIDLDVNETSDYGVVKYVDLDIKYKGQFYLYFTPVNVGIKPINTSEIFAIIQPKFDLTFSQTVIYN